MVLQFPFSLLFLYSFIVVVRQRGRRKKEKKKDEERKREKKERLFYSSQFGNKKATRGVCIGKETDPGSAVGESEAGVTEEGVLKKEGR